MTNGIGPRLKSTHRVTRESLTSLHKASQATTRWQFEIDDTPPEPPLRRAVSARRVARRL